MSNDTRSDFQDLSDLIAVQIQQLYAEKKIYDDQPLLRVDNRKEAKDAPFQFEIARSLLHRSDCDAIPIHAHSALYALWEIKHNDLQFACSRCKPLPILRNIMEKTTTSDLLYGFISLIDQFSTVLTERGREYRQSEKGKQMETALDTVLHELDVQQNKSIDLLITSLDGLINVLRDYNRNGGMPLKQQVNVKGDNAVFPKDKTNGRAKGKSVPKPKQRKK